MSCPLCGSANVEWIDWQGPTGVSAPDGYREIWSQTGRVCQDCGAIEEE